MTDTPTPFRIDIAQPVIDGILRRVREYDWHEMPVIAPGQDRWTYGTDMEYLRDLCAYWTGGYDWRAAEAALNRHPQFKATVEGQEIHFLHVRGSGTDGRALLLIHGWPGSFHEFNAVIDRLANPAAHGGAAADGIDVVVPSLPGFAFSGKPPAPIGPRRVAALFDRLMTETLGYARYVAQGGDWGAIISGSLGLRHALGAGGGCEALHLNMFGMRPDVKPETPEELAWAQRIGVTWATQERGYAIMQGTKPQTLSYGMMDSPVGVAGWIVEKFNTWADTRGADTRGANGSTFIENAVSRDDLLTNIMLYLVTRSFNTASWIYRGRMDEGGAEIPAGQRIAVPTAVANFPYEIIPFPSRRMVEAGYNVVRWTNFTRGGHFAALETGAIFADDVAAFLQQIRQIRQ